MSTLAPRSWFKPLPARDDGDLFAELQDRIDRVFENFSRIPTPTFPEMAKMPPRVNMAETDNAVEIEAELPGVDEKDVEVVIDGDVLSMKGEKKTEREEKKKDFHLRERTFGSFSRSLALPFAPAPASVKASYAKGVLKITLPKPAEVKQKTVKIPVSAAA